MKTEMHLHAGSGSEMRKTICILLLLVLAVLAACIWIAVKNRKPDGHRHIETGALLEFAYSPGYGDMNGASHYEKLCRNDAGEWIVVSRNRESLDEPMIETTYAVSAEAAAGFEAFLREKDIVSLSDRPDSTDFITDYSPWGYNLYFDNSSLGGKKRERYGIGEYKVYSDEDYALLKELNQAFRDLRGDKLSEVEETD